MKRTLVIKGGWRRCRACGRRNSRFPYDAERDAYVCPRCGAPVK